MFSIVQGNNELLNLKENKIWSLGYLNLFLSIAYLYDLIKVQSCSAVELSISPIVYFIKCTQLCYPKYCIFWNWFLLYKYIIDQQGRQIRWKIFYSSYFRALYLSFPVITLHFHMCYIKIKEKGKSWKLLCFRYCWVVELSNRIKATLHFFFT